jgi:hypothetical protein
MKKHYWAQKGPQVLRFHSREDRDLWVYENEKYGGKAVGGNDSMPRKFRRAMKRFPGIAPYVDIARFPYK